MKNDAQDDLKRLNPLINTTIIGKKELREIKLYPLSLADQLELSNLFIKTIQEISGNKEVDSNFDFAAIIRDALQNNLGKVLSLVTDEGEGLLKEITNPQAIDIVEIVYDSNYGLLEKKVKDLVEKIRKTFKSPQLRKSSPASSEPTLSTESKTFSENDTKKED